VGFGAGRNHLVLIAGLLALSAGISEAAGDARLVREIRTSSFLYSSLPSGFVGLGDNVYFVADSPGNGRELWRTDGTSEGTRLLRDIRPGSEDSDIGPLVAVGETLFFRADDGERHAELWKSDGTTAGTVLLKEFETFYQDYKPIGLTEFAGKLYFSHSRQSGLWTSDGTEEGTELVAPINSVQWFFNAGSKLFLFSGNTEIWTSDGTESGTKMVATGIPPYAASGFASVDGVLFFAVYLVQWPNDHSMALWKSDGTSAGTSVVAETFPGIGEPAVGSLTPFGHELLFTVSEYGGSTPRSLWKTDGTTAGTVKIAEGAGNEIGVSGGTAYFTAADEASGQELWATDGTLAGTRQVADLYPGPTGSFPEKLTDYDGMLVFTADEPSSGRELWKSDATPAGTQRIADLNPGTADSSPQNLGVVNGTLFFTATDGASGFELWKSDGNPSGTQWVANIAGDGDGSGIDEPTELNGVLYFKARANGDRTIWQGTGLWRSDGTEAGTYVVKEIRASGHSSGTPRYLRVFFDQLYFLAEEGYSLTELWTSDGTAEGTRSLTDLGPGTSGRVDYPPVQLLGSLIFAGREGGQYGLWRTNGIGEGTELLKSFAGMNLYFSGLKIAMGRVLFPADDGAGAGNELWRSDGTPDGTVLLKDLVPGSGNSMIWHAGVFRHLYFFAPYLPDEMGRELWVSNGTEAGTELFLDLMEGYSSSSPEYLTSTDRHLFFRP